MSERLDRIEAAINPGRGADGLVTLDRVDVMRLVDVARAALHFADDQFNWEGVLESEEHQEELARNIGDRGLRLAISFARLDAEPRP